MLARNGRASYELMPGSLCHNNAQSVENDQLLDGSGHPSHKSSSSVGHETHDPTMKSAARSRFSTDKLRLFCGDNPNVVRWRS
jgi:hypothetical protein